MLGLYLHIPFCQAICSYCNFNRGLFDAALKQRYVEAIEKEILTAGDGTGADTVFFGGGTPSLLEPAEIARLIRACREAYVLTPDAEVTLETNPETATPERLAAFRAAGVNRISFGVQSFDDGELQRLGRIHSAARAAGAVRAARAAGFDNLSFDLMFWLPGQSLASWLSTIDRAVDLAPDHLSLYLLELYPNAPLKETMARATGPGLVAAGSLATVVRRRGGRHVPGGARPARRGRVRASTKSRTSRVLAARAGTTSSTGREAPGGDSAVERIRRWGVTAGRTWLRPPSTSTP